MRTRKNIKKIYLRPSKNRMFTQKSLVNSKSKTRSKYKSKTRSNAGKAFAEGGFGCVFRPQLSCNKSVDFIKQPNRNGVSKLMIKKVQNTELKELNSVYLIVKKIKNYQDYFLVDNIYGCEPDALTKNDKVDFNKKCKNLVKKGIHKDNVNTKLNTLGIINLPYGGISIDDYYSKLITLHKTKHRKKSFISTNKSLLLLLTKAISLLQKSNFLHMDIKGANILRSEDDITKYTNIKTRLIDWGVSINYASSVVSGKTPPQLYNIPIQYNIPFSTILFLKDINVFIKKFFSEYSNNTTLLNSNDRPRIIKHLASYIYNISLDVVGEGHNNYILFIIDKINAEVFSPEDIIVEHLATILNKYIDDKHHFHDGEFFHNVYCKNVDIWGFIMSYIDLTDLNNTYSMRSDLSISVAKIISKYCFSTLYAIKPIPIHKLVLDLKSLNERV